MSERWDGQPSRWPLDQFSQEVNQTSPTQQRRQPGAIATPTSHHPQHLHHITPSHPHPLTSPSYYQHHPVDPTQANLPLNYNQWPHPQLSYHTQMEPTASPDFSEQTDYLSNISWPDLSLSEYNFPLVSSIHNPPESSNTSHFPASFPSADVSPDGASQSVPSGTQSIPSSTHTATSKTSVSPVPVVVMKKEEREAEEPLGADPHRHYVLPEVERTAALSVSPKPGSYGFNLLFSNTSETKSSQAGWLFSEEDNLLFVTRKNEFAVILTTELPLPLDCFLRVSVGYEDPSRQEAGPVSRCLKHLEEDKDLSHSEHFVWSKNPEAIYSEYQGHHCVNIPLSALADCEGGKVCVLSYSCFSSCLSGKGTHPLATVVRVVGENCVELGRASFGVRICACPARDKRKFIANRRKGSCQSRSPSPPSKRRALFRSSVKEEEDEEETVLPVQDIHPAIDLVSSVKPDKDGYYTFTWKTQNKFLYNLLLMMKAGYHAKKRNENTSC